MANLFSTLFSFFVFTKRSENSHITLLPEFVNLCVNIYLCEYFMNNLLWISMI